MNSHQIILFLAAISSVIICGGYFLKTRYKRKEHVELKILAMVQMIGFYSYAILSIMLGYKVFKFSHEYIFLCAGLFSIVFVFLSFTTDFLIGKLCLALNFLFSVAAIVASLTSKYTEFLHDDYIQEAIWLVHMSSNCTGVIFLSMSLLLGVNYLRNQNLIKRHGDLDQLDLVTLSLSKIDGMMSKLLFVVFAVINISLLTGIILAHSLWDNTWLSSPKFIVSSVMWLMFAVLVWGRLRKGWRGKVFVQGLFICEMVLVGLLLLSFVK